MPFHPGRAGSDQRAATPPDNLFKPVVTIRAYRGANTPGTRPRGGEHTMATKCIKKSGVRDAAGGMNVGADVYTEVDRRVQEMIKRAAKRARENGRKTLKARDV